MRYFLRLSFNGKAYHGWQVQENAHTVQAELNQALSTLLNAPIETTGCGRTDTGVHATEFFVHFDHDEITGERKFVHQLNSILPNDIAIDSLFRVADDAHARFSATSRTYEYRLYQKKNPFLKDQAYFFPHELDMEIMNNLANRLKTYTDFSSFSKSRTQTATNNCVLTFAEWKKSGNDQMIFTITADRFLRNMVRAIVGTLLQGGLHKLNPDDLQNILESKNRSEAGMSVPAHGLYLTSVEYPFPVV